MCDFCTPSTHPFVIVCCKISGDTGSMSVQLHGPFFSFFSGCCKKGIKKSTIMSNKKLRAHIHVFCFNSLPIITDEGLVAHEMDFKNNYFWLSPIFKNNSSSISVLATNFLIWKYVFTLGSERDLTEQQQHQKLKQYKKTPKNPLTVRIGEIKESWKKLHCDYKTEEEGTEKKWWNSWIKTQTVRTPFKITSWKTVRNSHLYHFMWNGEKLPLRSLHVKLLETPFNIISCETVKNSL